MIGPVMLDSDTLSELSRGNPRVARMARLYLEAFGRLTISAVSVFERLRGYRAAIIAGKPYLEQERSFRAFAATCRILVVDDLVADHAAQIWARLGARRRAALGDILIAATASAHEMPLVTRNDKDFAAMVKVAPAPPSLLDWTSG